MPLPEVTDATFESEVTRSVVPVWVEFGAAGNVQCRTLDPVVEQIAGQYAGRLKVVQAPMERVPETAARLEIRAVPTLVLVRGGREVCRAVGAQPKHLLVKLLDIALG